MGRTPWVEDRLVPQLVSQHALKSEWMLADFSRNVGIDVMGFSRARRP